MMRVSIQRAALAAGAVCASFLLLCAASAAQVHIGGAVAVKNDVRGQNQGQTLAIAPGDRVFQNEVVRTGADSLAKFMLLDETNVTLGPVSQIVLDRFVYDPDTGAKQVTLSAAKGAFRFISGRSPHEAYEVRTPQASIGVRGTTYDVRVESGRTIVVLQEGAVHVCRRNTQICADLTEPGQSLVVSKAGLEGPLDPARKTWDFGSLCGAVTAGDLCGRTTQFAFNNPKTPSSRNTTRRASVDLSPPRVKKTSVRQRIAVVERPQRIKPPQRVRRFVPIDDDDIDEEIILRHPYPVLPLALGLAFGGLRYGMEGSYRGLGFGRLPGRGNIGRPGR